MLSHTFPSLKEHEQPTILIIFHRQILTFLVNREDLMPKLDYRPLNLHPDMSSGLLYHAPQEPELAEFEGRLSLPHHLALI